MILYLTCAAYLAVAAVAGLLIGYLLGRGTGRKLGLSEGYKDGWSMARYDADMDAITGYDAREAARDVYDHETEGL